MLYIIASGKCAGSDFVHSMFGNCSTSRRIYGQRISRSRLTAKDDGDPISGEWSVSFMVPGHGTTPATFTFKLDGEKVTGTCYSEHTGAGTIRAGKWPDGKLSFVLDFAKHESIAVKGGLKDGKLAGEFTTEGLTANWEAKKKDR